MARKRYVWEVLEEVAKAKTKETKVKILKENDGWALKDIIKGSLDPKLEWNLPKGTVPYNACEEYNAPSNLMTQNEKFRYFVKGLKSSENLTKLKRETLFIGLCEAIHPKDSELLINMINKEKIKGLTKDVVNKAFPGLLP